MQEQRRRGLSSLQHRDTHQVADVEDDLRGVGGQVAQGHGAVDRVADVAKDTNRHSCERHGTTASEPPCCH